MFIHRPPASEIKRPEDPGVRFYIGLIVLSSRFHAADRFGPERIGCRSFLERICTGDILDSAPLMKIEVLPYLANHPMHGSITRCIIFITRWPSLTDHSPALQHRAVPVCAAFPSQLYDLIMPTLSPSPCRHAISPSLHRMSFSCQACLCWGGDFWTNYAPCSL